MIQPNIYLSLIIFIYLTINHEWNIDIFSNEKNIVTVD